MKKFFVAVTLCALMASGAFAKGFEAITLLDMQSDADVSMLVNSEGKPLSDADKERVAKYFTDGKIYGPILAFLVRIGGNEILFDTGLPDGHVAAELKKQGLAPEDVKIILLTHLHPDHFGGLLTPDGEATFPNAEIYVSRVERAYWVDEAKDKDVINALDKYNGRVHVFDFDDEVMPGVKAMETSGHTPGHVSFMLEQDGEKLLILGDLIHLPAIQLPIPEMAVIYDVDPKKAIETRKRIFDYVSENNIPVAGMHVPFPGTMKIKKVDGGYEEY